MFRIIFFAALPVLALGASFDLIPCVGVPYPKDFSIEECAQRPCNLKSGDKLTVHMTMDFDKTETILPLGVTAMNSKGKMYVFHDKSYDFCNRVDGGCPIESGTHTFKATITIPKVSTAQEVVFSGIMRDKDFNPIGCASIVGTVNP